MGRGRSHGAILIPRPRDKGPFYPLTVVGWVWAVLLVLVIPLGCQREAQSLEQFKAQWVEAIKQQSYQRLYEMLDPSSQRSLRQSLEVMRGLDGSAQQTILDQLEQEDLTDLTHLSPARYFGLLWHRATQGRKPIQVDLAPGVAGIADMLLTFEGNQRLHVRVVRVGQRWAWQLPDQSTG